MHIKFLFCFMEDDTKREHFCLHCHVTMVLWVIAWLVGSINTSVPFLAWLPGWRKCWARKKSLNQYGFIAFISML